MLHHVSNVLSPISLVPVAPPPPIAPAPPPTSFRPVPMLALLSQTPRVQLPHPRRALPLRHGLSSLQQIARLLRELVRLTPWLRLPGSSLPRASGLGNSSPPIAPRRMPPRLPGPRSQRAFAHPARVTQRPLPQPTRLKPLFAAARALPRALSRRRTRPKNRVDVRSLHPPSTPAPRLSRLQPLGGRRFSKRRNS